MEATHGEKPQKSDVKTLLADSMAKADVADRRAIAAMSSAERFALTCDLSEFAVRNSGAAKDLRIQR